MVVSPVPSSIGGKVCKSCLELLHSAPSGTAKPGKKAELKRRFALCQCNKCQKHQVGAFFVSSSLSERKFVPFMNLNDIGKQ
jgi:hypothetical protein